MTHTQCRPAVGTAACVPPGAPGPAPGGGNSKTDCATRSMNGRGLAVVGLVADGSLVCFHDSNTARLATIGTLTGFDQDTLYGVGDAGGMYTVDASTAAVKLVSRLDQPLQGSSFGVDFNPASTACASCRTPARTSASTSTTARRWRATIGE